MNNLAELYDTDYNAWVIGNTELLRLGKLEQLDIAHLIEELEDMGKSAQHELTNRFITLLMHLLKWKYQLNLLNERWKEFDGKSWRSTIIEQRTRIKMQIEEAPGLKNCLKDAFHKAYPGALRLAVKETGLPAKIFPQSCPFSLEQTMDDDFWPK
ncbi:DUF29 family protein [Gammaproteobacteria bacterium]